jgi:hypothetical protein
VLHKDAGKASNGNDEPTKSRLKADNRHPETLNQNRANSAPLPVSDAALAGSFIIFQVTMHVPVRKMKPSSCL